MISKEKSWDCLSWCFGGHPGHLEGLGGKTDFAESS